MTKIGDTITCRHSVGWYRNREDVLPEVRFTPEMTGTVVGFKTKCSCIMINFDHCGKERQITLELANIVT